ncbi:MAG: DUF1398 family protein [Chitinophagales bacterium]
MFTINEIKDAHSKVKSGADFPSLVQDLINLGVVYYDSYVIDGHKKYVGKDDYTIEGIAMYSDLDVAVDSNTEQFKHYLKIHQQGQTDYFTFCKNAAETGVEKWTVDTQKMTCTYYDKAGNKMLEEMIPQL